MSLVEDIDALKGGPEPKKKKLGTRIELPNRPTRHKPRVPRGQEAPKSEHLFEVTVTVLNLFSESQTAQSDVEMQLDSSFLTSEMVVNVKKSQLKGRLPAHSGAFDPIPAIFNSLRSQCDMVESPGASQQMDPDLRLYKGRNVSIT